MQLEYIYRNKDSYKLQINICNCLVDVKLPTIKLAKFIVVYISDDRDNLKCLIGYTLYKFPKKHLVLSFLEIKV